MFALRRVGGDLTKAAIETLQQAMLDCAEIENYELASDIRMEIERRNG